MKNYYRILGVKPSATDEEIKRNYRTLAKRYHPDVNPSSETAAGRFADVNEAYTVLTDAKKRAEFDAQLRAASDAQAMQRAKVRNAQAQAQAQAARQNAQFNKPPLQIEVEAQLLQQIQLQVQAQVQAQLAAVRDKAFKTGYEQGAKDGQAYAAKNAAAETAQIRKKASEMARDRSDLEQELFDRDRRLAETQEHMTELETQLNWLRKTTRPAADTTAEILQADVSATQSQVEKLQAELDAIPEIHIENTGDDPSLLHAKGKQLKDALNVLKKQMSQLEQSVVELESDAKRARQAAEALRDSNAIEARADAWAKKQLTDKKLAKPTLYGTLGVLIWATPEEIDKAYKKLSARLSIKPDAEAKVNLQRIQAAYAVLSDPARREAYNDSIGYPAARIESERRMIKENEDAQSTYRNRLAARSFWTHFDELSALALSDDAEAQNALGELYYEGKFLDCDYPQAVYWFKEAFRHKYPKAVYNLGLCYYHGRGVPKNRSIASALFRQAKNLGVEVEETENLE